MISSNIVRDEEGLIVPRKLINPCLESSDRQNLHRELLFNQKIGKNVLNQKTELQRALEKQKERQVIAAQNEMNKDCHTTSLHGELGKVIMERAQKNRPKDEQNTCNNTEFNEEYLKARAKLRGCNKYT
ncbi:CLUMA_CG014902, isoform A [Clunio marinus]|uniref:CLUMA_CG014902, isoform A n=1 Tax=Clunio marinus TaxID=568069 RepID=A0A1J1IN85_9DIPT|nr:CLUMA_CG014902, isoform A [Clunio marinus]